MEEQSGVGGKFHKIFSFSKKHAVLLTLLLVLVLQWVPNPHGNYPWGGMWIRMQSSNLPIADSAAASSVDNYLRQQASVIANQQYPNLPDSNKQKVVNDLMTKLKTENKDKLAEEQKKVAQQIRDHYMYDSDGREYLYMPDIDPYFYLRYARNIVEKGHSYDILKDGVPWDNHMVAPVGTYADKNWHPYTAVILFKFAKIFDSRTTLMQAANYQPVVFIFLSLIFVFLIAQKVSGNVGGFFAATILAVVPAVMGRTLWGHFDTDAYNVFFPVATVYVLMLALSANSVKKQALFGALAGLVIAIYSNLWSGWWYVFDFVLGAFAFSVLGEIVNQFSTRKQNIFSGVLSLLITSPFIIGFAKYADIWSWPYASVLILSTAIIGYMVFIGIEALIALIIRIITEFTSLKHTFILFWHHSRIKKFITVSTLFLLSSVVFCTLTIGFSNFFEGGFKSALGFTVIKNAALANLWPNVYTTVAELNPATFKQIVASIGDIPMLTIALIGIVLLLLKRDENHKFDITYSALLSLWFIGTIYASFKGLRFTLLLGPAFAVAFGAATGLLTKWLASFGEKSLHLNKILTNIIVIIIIGVIIVSNPGEGAGMVQNAYGESVNDVPLVNDAWWNVLTAIKDGSQPDAIINSWWDFGHHFKYIADRATTSDGAVQNSPQAHWVGKVLQTDNEREAVGILHMLDCGANSAYDFALNSTQDPVVAFKLVNDMIMQDKEKAGQLATAAGVSEEILKYTHCDPPEDFFIASADMVGKAGVWAHFGLWTFEKAEVWQKWRLMSEDEAVPQMVKRFNWTEAEAKQAYNEANALSSEDAANAWISPWPGYLATDSSSCSVSGDTARCGSNIAVNLTNKHAEVRLSQGIAPAGKLIVYSPNGDKQIIETPGGNAGLSVVMWPTSDGVSAIAASTPLADSMFTRMFFMKGLGLKNFKPFATDHQLIGGDIYAYKVDWEGSESYVPTELAPKTQVEPGAKVALSYIGWTDDNVVFDSSIPGWRDLNVTPDSRFEDFETKPLAFVAGQGKVIPGFEKRIAGMKKGETKTIVVPPEEAYGTDPTKHPLGNKTLHFKIRVDNLA